MNITFLIGNGFDINLGLKTRYTNFYPYYLEKYPEEMIAKLSEALIGSSESTDDDGTEETVEETTEVETKEDEQE